MRLAASAEPLHSKPWNAALPEGGTTETASVRVAVASGPAFSFVYRENLELLRAAGAETVFFDPTTEEDLPEGTDALYLGGGFRRPMQRPSPRTRLCGIRCAPLPSVAVPWPPSAAASCTSAVSWTGRGCAVSSTQAPV
jgi:hypothetical protein